MRLFLLTIVSFALRIPSAAGMYFVSRAQWGARPPDEAYIPITNPKGVKIHYLGESFTAIEHAQCDDHMRSIQNYEMDVDSENYFDFAYSLAVCQHGYVFDGRGAGHRSGANGNQDLNAAHYAVVAFVGSAGVTEPSQYMVEGIQDAVAYLRRNGAGNEIKGHRDGYATLCPGEPLYAMVKDGSIDPGVLYNGGTHTVKAGETLDDISAQYNVPKRYIISVNNLKEPYTLTAGQNLTVPARGVPIDGYTGGGGDDPPTGDLVPFPGVDWFKSKPNSPIITAMGKRLVAEGCSAYSNGPGPQWTDADLSSYKLWQEKLGFTGADADGWPGKTSWDKLRVTI
ncbi:hypothetical protein ACEPPN_015274 [Leptodophora sp. 'Broadleaf-Isolate-01']